MSDQEFWDLCFMHVAGIRFHPANDKLTAVHVSEQIRFSSEVASEMAVVRAEVLCRLESD